jgi:tRNA 2-(methylsulfanyl)-N6-isopentenyladenosine37 hydroxylase
VARKSVDLAVPSPADWLPCVLNNFDAFLADHANCERKASAMAMGMVVKYPDRPAVLPMLIDVAREELDHFAQVYAVMRQRGVALVRDSRDEYIMKLMEVVRHGRDDRFLDRLLMASIVECRGAERFGLIADSITEPQLASFYDNLRKSETKHGHVFADLALKYFSPEVVYARAAALGDHEAKVIEQLAVAPALH